MDPRLLRYYNEELRHLREMGEEFAQQFPKIAARLGLEKLEVTDPHVERLLEGFASSPAASSSRSTLSSRASRSACWRSSTRSSWHRRRRC